MAEAYAALAHHIRNERPRRALVDVDLMECEDPSYQLLLREFANAGWVARSYPHTTTLYEPTTDKSFEDYWAERPSILRHTLKRRSKKLEKKGDVRLELITGGSEIDRGIRDYERVLAASWKEPEPYPNFASGLIRECAAANALRLALLYLDGEPAAAQFWIVAGGRATIYKLHYDEAFAKLSVGTILTAFVMRHVIDVDGVEEVDFGRGDEDYKRGWLSQERRMCGFVAFNPSVPRGALALGRHAAGEAKGAFVELVKPIAKPAIASAREWFTRSSERKREGEETSRS